MINEYDKSKLNKKAQTLYEQMVGNFERLQPTVECKGFSANDIRDIYVSVYNDHPEFFYLSHIPQISEKISFSGRSTTLLSESIFSKGEILQYRFEMNKILKSLAALTKNCLTDFEIEKVVCDYLIKNTNYEINNTYNQNAATVLVKNKGQCSGIARAVKYIFDYFDIECLKIDGTAGEAGTYGPHSWNIVKIDGEYYHLDVTCMIGANMSKSQPFRYAYLNYSDTQIATNHTWERDKYPKCNVDSPIKTTQTTTANTSAYANSSQSTGRVTPDKTIYSYGEFKREIGAVYDNNGTRLFFLSKIPAKDSQELIDTLLKEAINEARVRNIGVSVNISSINSDITVSIERK